MSQKILAVFTLILLGYLVQGQEVKIELGPDEIGVNQAFTISIVSENERINDYSPFPQIDGMVKRGTSTATSTRIVNGQISSTYTITQNYYAQEEGVYVLTPFEMQVNGQTIRSPGKRIQVGPPVQQRRNRSDPFQTPFDDMFSRDDVPTEYIDVEDDAFLALTADKKEVYVGEGLTATLAFYVAESNRAPLRFYDLGKQLADILKVLKPSNCWEENFNIENIDGNSVNISGKRYTQYKIYQAAFYPLNTETIKFPSVGLEMIKYKVRRNPSFFGRNRQEDFKTFTSKPKSVEVKDLPPHPLKESVSVGVYRLEERISSREVKTGNSFNYKFEVYGEGNISAINKPVIKPTENINFYDPSIQQKIVRRNNIVTGSKSFNYYGIPNEPGVYDLGNYFQWIYFNLDQNDYDTLKAHASINVFGGSRKNEAILSTDLGSFYDKIETQDNELTSKGILEGNKLLINILILIMIVATAFIIFKK